jgi:hypothetical protein
MSSARVSGRQTWRPLRGLESRASHEHTPPRSDDPRSCDGGGTPPAQPARRRRSAGKCTNSSQQHRTYARRMRRQLFWTAVAAATAFVCSCGAETYGCGHSSPNVLASCSRVAGGEVVLAAFLAIPHDPRSCDGGGTPPAQPARRRRSAGERTNSAQQHRPYVSRRTCPAKGADAAAVWSVTASFTSAQARRTSRRRSRRRPSESRCR